MLQMFWRESRASYVYVSLHLHDLRMAKHFENFKRTPAQKMNGSDGVLAKLKISLH